MVAKWVILFYLFIYYFSSPACERRPPLQSRWGRKVLPFELQLAPPILSSRLCSSSGFQAAFNRMTVVKFKSFIYLLSKLSLTSCVNKKNKK